MPDDVIKALFALAVGLAALMFGAAAVCGLAAWQRWREERERER